MLTWVGILIFAATPIGLDEALGMVSTAPEIAAESRAVALRRQAETDLNRLTSNPTFSVQPGIRSDTGSWGPSGQLGLTQSFNLAGLGTRRVRAVAHETQLAESTSRQKLLARRLATIDRWFETWNAQTAIQAVAREVQSVREISLKIDRQVTQGHLTQAEGAQMRAFVGELDALRLHFEGLAFESGAALGSLIGRGEIINVQDDLPKIDRLSESALHIEQSDSLPAVHAALRAVQLTKSLEQEVTASSGSHLQLSLLAGNEYSQQWFAGVGLGLTFPLFERGQRERADLLARHMNDTGNAEAAVVQAQIDIRLALHEIEHSEEVYEVVHNTQLAAALLGADLERRRFEAGEVTLQELLVIQRQALGAIISDISGRSGVIAARARARELLASIKSREAQ